MKLDHAAIVIGSGHAGLACTKALVAAGVVPLVIDGGDEADPQPLKAFETLASTEPDAWPPDLAEQARAFFPASIRGVPLKPSYGSLFSYSLNGAELSLTLENAEVAHSLARGGLSNTWGSSMLPYSPLDVPDWPLRIEDLAPYYRAVLDFVPLAGRVDDLAERFPLFTEPAPLQYQTPQIEDLMRRLDGHRPALRAAGIVHGSSRLGVVGGSERDDRCRYCGLCMHGCPYGSIYNTHYTLDQIVRDGQAQYRPGLYVDHLTEVDGGVRLSFHDRDSRGTTGSLVAERVFVACGPVSSTRLVLNSLDRGATTAHLADSQTFIMPMLSLRSHPVTTESQGNTLAQIFLEVNDNAVSRRTVHLQVYGYSDIMLKGFIDRLRLNRVTAERLLRPLLGRLVVIQGFIHSDDSPGLLLDLMADGVRLRGDDRPGRRAVVALLTRKLLALAPQLGMAPVPPLVQIGLPGKSFHFGSSMPMSSEPRGIESDLLGRPRGFSRVHVVDASVLPSIAATTIALTTMANAYRIGAQCALQLPMGAQ